MSYTSIADNGSWDEPSDEKDGDSEGGGGEGGDADASLKEDEDTLEYIRVRLIPRLTPMVIKDEEDELKKMKNTETAKKTQDARDIYRPWRDAVQ
jgi:hypothetical protein